MDDATQNLAHEAWDAREATLFHDAPDEAKAFIAADRAGFLAGFEAAQRPPVAEPDNHHNADVCPFCTRNRDEREAAIRAEALAQRPPVSRDDPIPRYAQLDLWMALFGAERSEEYETFREVQGFAETWSWLLARVREWRSRMERPPVSPEVDRLRAQVEAAREAWWSGTEQGDTGLVYTDRIEDAMDAIWDAIGHAEWTPRQRPPVSPEQREALEWAGVKALVESPEVPTGVRALLIGEVFTIREAVDAEPVVRVVLDALLARFSLPVLDVEKVAQFIQNLRDANAYPSPGREPSAFVREWAAALVASLHTLTDEEKNDA